MNKTILIALLILAIVIIFSGVVFLYLNLGELPLADINFNLEKEEKEISYEVSLKEDTLRNDNYEISFKKIESNSLGGETVNSFIENEIKDFKDKANSKVPNLRENNFEHKYIMDIGLESYQTEDYLSYILNIGKYTGGANMNQIIKNFTFDKRKNKEIKLSEIILPNKQDEFIKKVRTALKEEDTFPGVEESFYFSDIHSFYFTENKINILFSKYEVAPGAAGIIEISINRNNLVK